MIKTSQKKVIDESNGLKDITVTFSELAEELENQEVSYELLQEEEDADLQQDLEKSLKQLGERINQFELQMLLSEPHDAKMRYWSCILAQAGQSHKTGRRCYCGCTPVGRKNGSFL